ncbi:ATP-dependent DNA helicase RecG [Patescibacteria group bacterium]|nr:ATP-dependent DNA helicase RecG [Patescibacteria group bacterium]MCG2693386.1 ATP-dependent DNA helicase RecG [Candidatus Parcubacteria bacterium]
MLSLTTPVSELTRVGKTTASRLKKLGLETARDLLFYYPFRYDDFSKILPIAELQPEQTATIKGRIEIIQNKRSPVKRKIITEAIVADESEQIKVIWFNQAYLTKVLKPGDQVYIAGKVDYDNWGIQFINPSYEKIEAWKKETTHTARLVPIYSVTEHLTQKQIRFLTKTALPLTKQVADFLPAETKKELQLIDLSQALSQIHFPASQKSLERAQTRLKFDELFLIQLQSERTRQELQKLKASAIQFHKEKTKKFVDSLPFKLTDAQRKAAWEIIKDLEKNTPMNRLLEGEVGSGKTMVAVIAALNVIWSGFQTILMAPTEILAKQHYENIKKILKQETIINKIQDTNKFQIPNSKNNEVGQNEVGRMDKARKNDKRIKVDIYTRTEKSVKKKDGLLKSDFIIGTHALIQEDVKFEKLDLVIVDEQHRFGVEQRKKLKQQSDLNNRTIEQSNNELKSSGNKIPPQQNQSHQTSITPHFLSMTATPIPRSLALTLYGDLDLSVIDQMPTGRKPITTKIVDPTNRQKAYDFIQEQIKASRQVFVICPLIEESDKLGVKAATAEHEKIDKQIFPHLRVGLLHGKLKTKEKEQIRQDFWKGKLDILVATSVIEVGIDVPNATVMMIEGADRFGLAQLHQFRGRVGRSDHQSYCFLFTESASLKTKKRLDALIQAKNGFELAEKDLEIRGPGEIYGTNQSGFLSSLKIAKLTDYDIIKQAREQAEKIIKKNPELLQYPGLKEKVENFEQSVHLE